ncbi:MAG: phosphomethylpyrimidine kinase, partial [Oscillospiraceae bacterium]|nr:phosphomethylpyrimidine kinase [Oscillospiraceae bacterium]
MHNEIPRVAAIHDLSGFGRCSLSVIAPTLSVMGVQCCSIPTMVLSTHTGGFGAPSMCDLTDYIKLTLKHYKEIEIDFNCVYTWYLGSLEQIDHCIEFCKSYPNALKVVDPVMGD